MLWFIICCCAITGLMGLVFTITLSSFSKENKESMVLLAANWLAINPPSVMKNKEAAAMRLYNFIR